MSSVVTQIAAIVRTLAAGLLLASIALVPVIAAAQSQDPASDPFPLQRADLSSPRDTLRSFLTDMADVIESWNQGARDNRSIRSGRRAIETLDLSDTPHGATLSVQIRRALLLYEILSRTDLPAFDQIPGKEEVARGNIARWAIPNTGLTIQRGETGLRTGAYRFSPGSVERLDRSYRRVRHLPTKAGVPEGIYRAWLRDDGTPYSQATEIRNRLKAIDTSSPRSTLDGFLTSLNRAYLLSAGTEAALRAEPSTITLEEARQRETAARNLMRRAIGALDLSEVPQAVRQRIGIEIALQLKEVIDRSPLPPYDSVPGTRIVETARQSATGALLQSGGSLRWRYPNTEIEIVELTEGPRTGEFLFSARTVDRTDSFYEKVKDLPYRAAASGLLDEEWYLSADISEGFYESYVSTPGFLVPLTTALGRFFETMPAWLKGVVAGQTLWQWISLVLSVVAAIGAALIAFRLVSRWARRAGPPLDGWVKILSPLAIAVVVSVVGNFVDQELNVTGRVLITVASGASLIVLVMIAWAVFLACKAMGELVIASPRITEGSVDASFVRLGARVVGFLLGAWIVIHGVSRVGFDVVPLLAGLGIGGLAVALAARPTLENLIGGLMLYAARPVRTGDFCRFGDEMGTVEHIGMQTTRIRTLERTVVSVPNAQFSQMQLDNYTTRDRRLFRTKLPLRYETTPEQMRYVLAKIRELLVAHPEVTPDPARARFVGLGAHSKDVEIFAYLYCRDINIFLAIREDILLRIEEILAEAGTGYAIPAQTTYLTRDGGLDAERQDQAVRQVEAWRSERKLPFPEFDERDRTEFENSLDYPPEGSPDHNPKPRPAEPKTGSG